MSSIAGPNGAVEIRITSVTSGDLICTCKAQRFQTVMDLKKNISEMANVPVSEQKLMLGHLELSDSSCLADVSAAGAFELAIAQGSDDMVDVQVVSAMCGDHMCTITVQRSQAIIDVKRGISEVTCVPVVEQKLLLGNLQLSDVSCLADVSASRTVELTLLREQRAVNGVLASFLNRILDETPDDANEDWQGVGDWSSKEVLGDWSQAVAARMPWSPGCGSH